MKKGRGSKKGNGSPESVCQPHQLHSLTDAERGLDNHIFSAFEAYSRDDGLIGLDFSSCPTSASLVLRLEMCATTLTSG